MLCGLPLLALRLLFFAVVALFFAFVAFSLLFDVEFAFAASLFPRRTSTSVDFGLLHLRCRRLLVALLSTNNY